MTVLLFVFLLPWTAGLVVYHTCSLLNLCFNLYVYTYSFKSKSDFLLDYKVSRIEFLV